MRQTRARAARGTMSLETLDSWLETAVPTPKVDGVSMLDGYLTALVVGPCSIPPDEWFVDLLGVNGHIGAAQGQHLAAIMAVVARFNAIGQTLAETPDKNAPIFEREDDGRVLAAPWCSGFLTAMRLRWIAWQPMLDLDRIEHGLMLPILLHCTDETGRPMLGPPRSGPKTKEFLRDAYHDIPLVIPQIRETWMPQRLKER